MNTNHGKRCRGVDECQRAALLAAIICLSGCVCDQVHVVCSSQYTEAPAYKATTALNRGEIEKFEKLLPDITDKNALDQLYWNAASDGNPRALKLLLAHGVLPATLNNEGLTPLFAVPSPHYGNVGDKQATLTTLVAHGVPVDSSTEFGLTPLLYAASQLDVTSVKFLLSRGANRGQRINKTVWCSIGSYGPTFCRVEKGLAAKEFTKGYSAADLARAQCLNSDSVCQETASEIQRVLKP